MKHEILCNKVSVLVIIYSIVVQSVALNQADSFKEKDCSIGRKQTLREKW
jgi:hypothetical protein